jgi:hypothetical protein
MKPYYEIGDILRDTKGNIHYLVEGIKDKNYQLRHLEEDRVLLACMATLAYDVYIVKEA